MPSIMQKNVAAGTANALSTVKFRTIPAGGAQVTLYASTAVAGGNISFSAEQGERDILSAAQVNIEASADVVDTDRDLVLFKEPVDAGDLFLAVNDQICNFLLIIEY